jgi:hypothetical protein
MFLPWTINHVQWSPSVTGRKIWTGRRRHIFSVIPNQWCLNWITCGTFHGWVMFLSNSPSLRFPQQIQKHVCLWFCYRNVSWFAHLRETWLENNKVSWFVHLRETWLGHNVSRFAHLRETWLGNNVSWFAHLRETWLGNNVSWFAHLQETWLGNKLMSPFLPTLGNFKCDHAYFLGPNYSVFLEC